MTSVPPPKKEGSVVRSVSVSSLPSFDKQAAPVEVPTTVVAAFRMPAQGLHVPAVGEVNSLPTKVSPPPPKPPPTATQKSCRRGRSSHTQRTASATTTLVVDTPVSLTCTAPVFPALSLTQPSWRQAPPFTC